MKRICLILLVFCLLFSGCATVQPQQDFVAATTKPVYQFASALMAGTDIAVNCVVTENVSCLHDYTLSVEQMKLLEKADAVLISGGGLEDFMQDALRGKSVVDCAADLTLTQGDPHYWLHPELAARSAETMAAALTKLYPQHRESIAENLSALQNRFADLQAYMTQQLGALSCRELIPFHDGFSYFAEAAELTILTSLEEEHGSEVAASDLIRVTELIRQHKIPAIFTETAGSENAAQLIAKETGAAVFTLDMVMGESEYFTAMKTNVDTIKEALQ